MEEVTDNLIKDSTDEMSAQLEKINNTIFYGFWLIYIGLMCIALNTCN